MITTEHVDKEQSQAQQASAPAVEIHAPRGDENTRPWLKPLLRRLSIVLSLIGGIVWVWCMMSFEFGAITLLVLLAFFVGVGFYSTWAAYTVTAMFSVLLPLGLIAGFITAFMGALLGHGLRDKEGVAGQDKG